MCLGVGNRYWGCLSVYGVDEGHINNIPTVKFYTGIYRNAQWKPYAIIDWVSGISKIMPCGILINMPYWWDEFKARAPDHDLVEVFWGFAANASKQVSVSKLSHWNCWLITCKYITTVNIETDCGNLIQRSWPKFLNVTTLHLWWWPYHIKI